MDVLDLNNMSKSEVLSFIRKTLTVSNVGQENIRYRFEMSGYENNIGQCTTHNQMVLNKFAFLGIYDYTDYLTLDFYKGIPYLWLKYFGSSDAVNGLQLSGYTTANLIYLIFEHTIFSNRTKRRRN